MKLKEHNFTLQGDRITLRPLTEKDWGLLYRWMSDPEVLYFAESQDIKSYSQKEVQGIYREVSQSAFCFMIEFQGQSIGECWLQQMNVKRLIEKFPGKDLRRIDIMIGEKNLWGKGLGTEAIGLLSRFGFEQESADLIFGLVSDYNVRSRKAFLKSGFEEEAVIEESIGEKPHLSYDLALRKKRYIDLRDEKCK